MFFCVCGVVFAFFSLPVFFRESQNLKQKHNCSRSNREKNYTRNICPSAPAIPLEPCLISLTLVDGCGCGATSSGHGPRSAMAHGAILAGKELQWTVIDFDSLALVYIHLDRFKSHQLRTSSTFMTLNR